MVPFAQDSANGLSEVTPLFLVLEYPLILATEVGPSVTILFSCFSAFPRVLSYFLCLLELLAEYLPEHPSAEQGYFVYLLTDADAAWSFYPCDLAITIPINNADESLETRHLRANISSSIVR